MSDIREMITEYSREARRLAEYKKKLTEQMAQEHNTDRLKELELRKSTVESERYEVLGDLKALLSYEAERTRCRTGA